MTTRVHLAVSDAALLGAVRAAVERGDRISVGDPRWATEFDVLVVDLEGLPALNAAREVAPLALAIVVGPAARLAELRLVQPLEIYAAIPQEQLASWLPEMVRRAAEARSLRALAESHRSTLALLGSTHPADLPGAIADAVQRALSADEVVLFVPGDRGKLQVAAESRPGSAKSAGTADPLRRARERRTRGGIAPARHLVPTDRLRRRSERLVRDAAAAPELASIGEISVLGQILGEPERPHGVLWAVRSSKLTAADARTLAGILECAKPPLDHRRSVADLEARLTALHATRTRLEEGSRAAGIGRLAEEALRRIQGPLAYIRTNLRFLASTSELATRGQGATHLQYAMDGLARAERLVGDVQRVGDRRPRVPMEMREWIDGALAVAGPLTIPVSAEVADNGTIRGRSDRVVEALAELVKNAAQTPAASRIDIRASRAGEDLAVEVVDDGEGIPEDILFRVSEPFFSTRGRAGLGLTIARDAVEAAGGSLQIASRPGIGTRARIVLPAHRQDDADQQFEADGDELTEEA